MSRTSHFVLISALCVAAASLAPLYAEDPPPPCSAEQHRQFDFWIGEWEVHRADGVMAGTNTIRSILGGCVLAENWTSAKGNSGKSFNIYAAKDGRWHQTWVDDSGTLLEIAGGLSDGKMVMNGEGKARDGADVKHRITWELLDDGRVRQHWQVSRDGGESWNDAFLGFYSRKE